MSSPKTFDHISPRVLNALDREFTGGQDLVPEDQASKLNEESLIQLLRDKKRAETYRIITDKRNAFLKEAYEGSDKSFADLTQEFASFSADQTHKWAMMEEKMSSILLEFKAKKEPINIDEMKVGLNVATEKISEHINQSVGDCNVYMDNFAGSFFNKDVNGVSRVGSDELKGFLRSKVEQFKTETQQFGEQQKNFINGSVKKLIQGKFDKIKSGELDEGALNRSDLFTDEEINAIHEEQIKLVDDAITDRKTSNINAVNEMTQKFIGVSGKESLLRKLSECPSDIITDDIKKYISDAFDNGCMFLDSEEEGTRRARAIGAPDTVCFALDYAALMLSDKAKTQPSVVRPARSGFYNFCNSGTYYLAHLFTWGFCTGYTVAALVDESQRVGSFDYKEMSNVLSGISFWIGMFNPLNGLDVFSKIASLAASKACEGYESKPEIKHYSWCSSLLLVKSTVDVRLRPISIKTKNPALTLLAVGTAVKRAITHPKLPSSQKITDS